MSIDTDTSQPIVAIATAGTGTGTGVSHSNKTILGCTTGMFAVFVMAEIVGAQVSY